MISIGVIGATGYTGSELLRLLAFHPMADVQVVTSESSSGQRVGEHFPGLYRYHDLVFTKLSREKLPELNLFFLCLPHGAAMEWTEKLLDRPTRVIDLSADFRLKSVVQFEKWYEQPHSAPHLCQQAAYGLTEIYREEIHQARLVANPGCYPTSVLLPLIPLLRAKLPIDPQIIVDSKSGVSGAGRNPGMKGQFVVVNENFSAYKAGRAHRHVGEMEEKLNQFSAKPVQLIFTPHLLPVNRGILSTIYLKFKTPVTPNTLHEIFKDAYREDNFIRILPPGELPQLVAVRHSNRCDIGFLCLNNNQNAIIVSCIDNLLKGASGQAIQNMNLLFDLPETTGLPLEGVIS